MPNLTALQVKNLSKPGRYGDGNGLYLRVKPSGAKSWVLRAVFDGSRHDVGLGPYPKISLADARRTANDYQTIIAQGRNPLAERISADVPTFAQAAEMYHTANTPRWTSIRHAKGWISSLRMYAFPTIGHLPLDRITQTHILNLLLPIWTDKRDTASKVRQRIRAVFALGMAHNWVHNNPAGEPIDAGLPKIPRRRKHHPALPHQQVAEALRTITSTKAHPTSKLCLRFLILTAARSGEARQANWSEIVTPAREWTIPFNRTKTREPHRIPLSDSAMEIIQEAHELRLNDLIFPSARGKVISDSTLSKLLRENDVGAVPHGFRSSFRDWAAENTDASWAAMELSLAHRVGSDTERAYARSDLFERRRVLMQKWADYLTSAG